MTDTDTPAPLSAERHAEIQTAIRRAAVNRGDLNPENLLHAWILATWDLADEVKRLSGELAKYTGWEPTVREEYEHACAEADRLTTENDKLKAWLCFCPERPPEAFDPDEQCPVHGDPGKALSMRAALAKTERWRGAFEALHARLLRDLPGDGSELAPPDDVFWAAQLDGLLTYAGELYRETEAGAVPAAADKQRS